MLVNLFVSTIILVFSVITGKKPLMRNCKLVTVLIRFQGDCIILIYSLHWLPADKKMPEMNDL